jgi:hypothetical protein
VEVATDDGTVVTGRVTGADDTGADLQAEPDDEAPRRVLYRDVRRALIQVEFARKEG